MGLPLSSYSHLLKRWSPFFGKMEQIACCMLARPWHGCSAPSPPKTPNCPVPKSLNLMLPCRCRPREAPLGQNRVPNMGSTRAASWVRRIHQASTALPQNRILEVSWRDCLSGPNASLEPCPQPFFPILMVKIHTTQQSGWMKPYEYGMKHLLTSMTQDLNHPKWIQTTGHSFRRLPPQFFQIASVTIKIYCGIISILFLSSFFLKGVGIL